MYDWTDIWYMVKQSCRALVVCGIGFGIFMLIRNYMRGNGGNQKYMSQEEREANARSYGEEGAKQAMQDSLKRKGKVSLILLIVGLVTLFIFPPLGIGCIVAMIIILTKGSSQEIASGTDPETLYRVNFLEPALDKVFPEGHSFNRLSYLSDNNVLSALPDMGSTSFSNYISGSDLFSFTHKGVPMQFSHNICKVESGHDSDGDQQYKRVFDGEVYEASYRSRLGGYVRIVPTVRHLGHESTGDYMKLIKGREVKIETDNIYFNEHFDVFATSQQDALYVLNPVVINFFTDYAQQGHRQAMFVSGNSFVIAREGVSYDVFNTPRSLEQIDALSVEGKCREFTRIGDTCFNMLQAINGLHTV